MSFCLAVYVNGPKEDVMSRDPYDKFTERARRTLTLAVGEAHYLKHDDIGTEHLLLGLISEGDGIAGRILHELGLNLDTVRYTVQHHSDKGKTARGGELKLTHQAQKALELARDESRRQDHHYIGTEHLLLGLIRAEGIAVDVLKDLGINLGTVRENTLELMRNPHPRATQPNCESITHIDVQIEEFAATDWADLTNQIHLWESQNPERKLSGLVLVVTHRPISNG